MKITSVLLAALLATSAHADFKNGNDILNNINNDNYYNKGHSMGYIMGLLDAYSNIFICPPSELTGGQAQDIVKNYLVQNPATRHQGASGLVYSALVEFFPCKKTK